MVSSVHFYDIVAIVNSVFLPLQYNRANNMDNLMRKWTYPYYRVLHKLSSCFQEPLKSIVADFDYSYYIWLSNVNKTQKWRNNDTEIRRGNVEHRTIYLTRIPSKVAYVLVDPLQYHCLIWDAVVSPGILLFVTRVQKS